MTYVVWLILYQWGNKSALCLSTERYNYQYLRFKTNSGIKSSWLFLEAHLLSNNIDVIDSLTHYVTPSLTGHLATSAISPLVVDLFGRSFGFATYNLIRKLFLMVSWLNYRVFRRVRILSDFIELSFCGPCFGVKKVQKYGSAKNKFWIFVNRWWHESYCCLV